jgi:mono/diheme cytochrome c family protein
MKRFLALSLATLSVLSFVGCEPTEFKEGMVMAGGQYVSAATLNKGKQIYAEYCMACHGVKGDGNGVAAKGLQPPPRNFTLGIIKFGNVVSGELTHDDAIYRTLEHGLNGTAMLPWDLKKDQMVAVWQYIKTFAPDTWVGKDKELGEKLDKKPFKDPFTLARRDQAIELGKKIYHVEASCQTCHRGYVSEAEMNAMNKELTGDEYGELDEEFYQLKRQESDHNYAVIPPDFTWHELRSIRDGNVEDIYLRLLAGVGGTSMPAWKDTLTDNQIWALAYYVDYLRGFKNSPERKNFVAKLKK